MPIDRKFLGRKVARYRIAQMAQPVDVFRGTGIDVERLCAIENGEVEPTGDEILTFTYLSITRPQALGIEAGNNFGSG